VIVLPGATGFGLAVLITLRSACVPLATPIVTVAELFAVFESWVVVVPVAVSVINVPGAALLLTRTFGLNVVDVPGA
jgi:hypothetical protein